MPISHWKKFDDRILRSFCHFYNALVEENSIEENFSDLFGAHMSTEVKSISAFLCPLFQVNSQYDNTKIFS